VGSGRAAAPARSGTKSGKKAANLKEMGRGNFARHTRHLGNFMRGSLCVDVADRKGQAGLAEFWKPLRDRRDLRERRYCAFPRLRLASFNGVSALILNGKKKLNPVNIFVPLLEFAPGGAYCGANGTGLWICLRTWRRWYNKAAIWSALHD
jgi:hypothetical protein